MRKENKMGFSYDSAIVEHIPRLREAARRAKIIIEMGLYRANGSTMAFQEGFSENKSGLLWVGIDVDLSKMKYTPTDLRFRLLKGSTIETSTVESVQKMLLNEAKDRGDDYTTADVIFIDTIHTYEQMKRELELWGKLASNDVLWMFHDTNMEGKYNHMTDAIKEYAIVNGYSYYDFTLQCHGLGMMFRE